MLSNVLDSINAGLETLFSNSKRDLLSSLEHYTTLSGMVELAALFSGGIPEKDTINSLIKISANYIDAVKSKTQANLNNLIAAYSASSEPNIKQLRQEIKDILNSAKYQLQTVIDTQLQQAKALGSLAGIMRVNTLRGIKDPVVFWVVVNDKELCVECKRLHLMPDEITPRLWYLSEVKHGYAKRGDDKPSLSEQHPNGRCVIETLLPGFGFNGDGRVTWIKEGYDAIKEQRE